MEYLLYNFLMVFSKVFDFNAFSGVIREVLGNYDRVFVDMLFSDVIGYVIFFALSIFFIIFIVRFFIACLRKFFEVITG